MTVSAEFLFSYLILTTPNSLPQYIYINILEIKIEVVCDKDTLKVGCAVIGLAKETFFSPFTVHIQL